MRSQLTDKINHHIISFTKFKFIATCKVAYEKQRCMSQKQQLWTLTALDWQLISYATLSKLLFFSVFQLLQIENENNNAPTS